jgi:hypothetical protein
MPPMAARCKWARKFRRVTDRGTGRACSPDGAQRNPGASSPAAAGHERRDRLRYRLLSRPNHQLAHYCSCRANNLPSIAKHFQTCRTNRKHSENNVRPVMCISSRHYMKRRSVPFLIVEIAVLAQIFLVVPEPETWIGPRRGLAPRRISPTKGISWAYRPRLLNQARRGSTLQIMQRRRSAPWRHATSPWPRTCLRASTIPIPQTDLRDRFDNAATGVREPERHYRRTAAWRHASGLAGKLRWTVARRTRTLSHRPELEFTVAMALRSVQTSHAL